MPAAASPRSTAPNRRGKTTLALHVIANAQKEGGTCAFVDAEHALDPTYARKLGVKVDDLLVSQPDTGEQALEIAEMLVRSNAIDVIVVDSVAALVPRAELEGEMGDSFVGLQARLMSQALRKLTGAVHKSSTALIFINQLREKIGVMFGSPETTAGGRALKFYASTRIDIRRIGKIKEGEEVIGSRTKATVVKNKLAPPFRMAEFDVMFNQGISYLGDLIDLGVRARASSTSRGPGSASRGERLGQGRDRARQFLSENPEITKRIHAAHAGQARPAAAAAAEPRRLARSRSAGPAPQLEARAYASDPRLRMKSHRRLARRRLLPYSVLTQAESFPNGRPETQALQAPQADAASPSSLQEARAESLHPLRPGDPPAPRLPQLRTLRRT